MNVFVTGDSGSLGRTLVHRLRQEGHAVLALARSEASAEKVRSAGAEPVIGDLADLVPEPGRAPVSPASTSPSPAWVDRLQEVDAVVHAAAHMEFWGPDSLFLRENLRPTVALHDAAVRARVRRFVLVSAASVSTGSQRRHVVDESTPEGRPNIAYSRVKLATERALQRSPSGSTELAVLRPPFIWGRGMTTLDDLVAAAEAGRFAWIDGGRHVVDFIHVDNLADALVLALTRGEPGGTFYVSDGAPLPIREFFTPLLATRGVDVSGSRSFPRAVAAPLAAVMDRSARILRRRTAPPLTNWLVSFTGRDRSYDISAARTHLGYQPRITLAEGLAEMHELTAQRPTHH